MDYTTIIAYAFGILFLYIAIWIFYKPLRKVAKVLLSSALGCVVILVFNFLGGFLGLNIGVNLYTSLVVGSLGAPGMGLILVLQRILG